MRKGHSFGYKVSWISIRNNNIDFIRKELKNYLKELKVCPWEEGLKKAYEGNFFLTSPVNDWTFVVSSECYKLFPNLNKMSNIFKELHYYSTNRNSDFLEFRKYDHGRLIRSFSINDGQIINNEGSISNIEIEIANFEKENNIRNWKDDNEMIAYINSKDLLNNLGNEENIMSIAEVWSINPQQLENYNVYEYGYLYEEYK